MFLSLIRRKKSCNLSIDPSDYVSCQLKVLKCFNWEEVERNQENAVNNFSQFCLFGFKQIDKIQFQKGEQIEQVTQKFGLLNRKQNRGLKSCLFSLLAFYIPFSFNVIFSLHHLFFLYFSFIFILRFSTHKHKHFLF